MQLMSNAVFVLVKAQILKETLSYFRNSMKDLDWDYRSYLQFQEVAKIERFTTAEQLDDYLRDSRRMSLQEWMDSLSWNHAKPE